jgi:hypothetical protein
MNNRPNNDAFKAYHIKRYPYCNNCNNKVIRKTCILDHVVRLADGGGDVLENTQLLCLGCDMTKTSTEHAEDKIKKMMADLDSLKSHKVKLEKMFLDNHRKTKRERPKYNKYVKELQKL